MQIFILNTDYKIAGTVWSKLASDLIKSTRLRRRPNIHLPMPKQNSYLPVPNARVLCFFNAISPSRFLFGLKFSGFSNLVSSCKTDPKSIITLVQGAQTVLCGVVAPCYQWLDNKVPQLHAMQSEPLDYYIITSQAIPAFVIKACVLATKSHLLNFCEGLRGLCCDMLWLWPIATNNARNKKRFSVLQKKEQS